MGAAWDQYTDVNLLPGVKHPGSALTPGRLGPLTYPVDYWTNNSELDTPDHHDVGRVDSRPGQGMAGRSGSIRAWHGRIARRSWSAQRAADDSDASAAGCLRSHEASRFASLASSQRPRPLADDAPELPGATGLDGSSIASRGPWCDTPGLGVDSRSAPGLCRVVVSWLIGGSLATSGAGSSIPLFRAMAKAPPVRAPRRHPARLRIRLQTWAAVAVPTY